MRIVPSFNLAVLADGMGGHAAGDVASRLAVDTLVEYLWADRNQTSEDWAPDINENRLVEATNAANTQVRKRSLQDPECHDMGCTLIACYFVNNQMLATHVGDSRLYRYRHGKVEQISNDHTLAQEYLRMGLIGSDNLPHTAGKNALIRAIGIEDEVEIDVIKTDALRGDFYLLCSDGLTEVMLEEDMQKAFEQYGADTPETINQLIKQTNERGGPDNVSVIIVHIT